MAATPPETSVIEHELRVAARPETVFAFFTDPAKMVQWMGAEATLDPRPGGICRIAFQPTQVQVESVGTDLLRERVQRSEPIGEAAAVMSGRYVEVDPYRRIEFTWGWEQELLAAPPQSTIVEVSFIPDGEGTLVRFAHRQIPPATVGYHRAGWEHYLARLAIAAAGGDPGPDPWQRTADDRS
jgi:uncharacterized protein YndB with AHSA1/START domain